MPLSPELRQKLIDHTGADTAATEDDLVAAAVTELDARKTDLATLAEKAQQVPALSADVKRLEQERDTARGELQAKTDEVLALSSAAPKAPDPLVLSMYAETFEAKAETALSAGAPKAAVEYFANLVKTPDGAPSVLALSACKVAADGGKVKDARLGIAIMDGLAKLAKGGFGEGVATGFTPPAGGVVEVLSASGAASPAPTDPKAVAEREWDTDPEVRKGFSSKDNYTAVRTADLTGRLRVSAVR